jgi:glycosyltransferase involved in cell wall biosynthesis
MADDPLLNPGKDPEPLVSILVLAYNNEPYVVECLESIKKLNYKRLELIVSDDCSRDNTFKLTEEWAKRNADRFERTVVVRQEKNLGIVGNLQFLFDSAHGDYLAYIASDDVFVETAIECRLKVLLENRNIDAVFGNAELISSSGSVLKEKFIPERIARQLSASKLLLSSLLINWCVPGPVMLLRREATLEGGSLGPLPQDLEGEDRYIYVRLAVRNRLRFTDVVVAKWRFVPGSSSNPIDGSHPTYKYVLASDKKMRKALGGFNRLLLETKIATIEADLSKNSAIIYLARKAFFRLVTIQLRTVLDVRTAFHYRCLAAVARSSALGDWKALVMEKKNAK